MSAIPASSAPSGGAVPAPLRSQYLFRFALDASRCSPSLRALNEALEGFGVPPADRLRLDLPLSATLTVARPLSADEMALASGIVLHGLAKSLGEFSPRLISFEHVGTVIE